MPACPFQSFIDLLQKKKVVEPSTNACDGLYSKNVIFISFFAGKKCFDGDDKKDDQGGHERFYVEDLSFAMGVICEYNPKFKFFVNY